MVDYGGGKSSGAGCSKQIVESLASSSQSCFKRNFIEMGFSPTLVDKVLEENGEENADLLLETLFAYSATEKTTFRTSDSLDQILGNCKDGISSAAFGKDGSKLKDVKRPSPESSDSLDSIFGDCKDGATSAKYGTHGSNLEGLDAALEVNEDKRASLLRMNFSAQEIDFALDKLGEDTPIGDLVEFILAAQVAQSSGVDINNQTHANDVKEEDNTAETLFTTMDLTMRLLELGFSDDEISSAIENYGAETPIEELADSIFANRIANACPEKDEDPPALLRTNHSPDANYRNSLESPKHHIHSPGANSRVSLQSPKEHNRRRSFYSPTEETVASTPDPFFGADELHYGGALKGKKPKLEYEDSSDDFLHFSSPEEKPFKPKPKPHKLEKGQFCKPQSPFSQELGPNSASCIRKIVATRPYFFYANILDVSQDTWKKISQFLYAFAPEFVNTQFFSALNRKEGYIHNLPKDNRSPIFPTSPKTIEEALPHTKHHWPSWDTRKQLTSINSDTTGISLLCDRLRRILLESNGFISSEQQRDILHHCKSMNLVWIGEYKLNPIEPEQVERILGYPIHHTDRCQDRLGLLKHSLQTDTLGYHLSPLKLIFPNGVTILSLYTGIGGAEVAIHRLGIRLKGVVSVETSDVNRRVLRRWWERTEQRGELVQVEDINKLTSKKVESLVGQFGGFDLVICQNPFTQVHMDGGNPTGFDFTSFFEFVRVLQCVRNRMGCR